MTGIDHQTIACRFANALDRCDFAEAGSYLSPKCRYRVGDEEFRGKEAILDSYSSNAQWTEQVLDKVIYESEVQAEEGEHLEVLFTDWIKQGGLTHEYRCRQQLSMDEMGNIVSIVHMELHGERERLNAFLERCGIQR